MYFHRRGEPVRLILTDAGVRANNGKYTPSDRSRTPIFSARKIPFRNVDDAISLNDRPILRRVRPSLNFVVCCPAFAILLARCVVFDKNVYNNRINAI